MRPTIEERDVVLRASWNDARFTAPTSSTAEHFSIQVMGVVDDPTMLFGDGPFVDVVSYWPALKKWTITSCSRADADAMDCPVRVTYWQYMLPMPW